MAATLPDLTVLGRRPVPQNRQGFAQQDTASPGVALAQLGETIGRTGGKLVDEFQQRDDEQKLLEYRRKLIEFDKTRVHDAEKGAASKMGKDSFGIAKTLGEEFDTFAGDSAKELTTNRQRMLAQQMALGRKESILAWANGHELQQRKVFDAGEYQANIAAFKDQAALYPDQSAGELGQMKAATQAYMGRLGLSPEAIAATVKEDASVTHGYIIKTMVRKGDVGGATAYFDRSRGDMTAQHRQQAEGDLKEMSARASAQAFEDDVVARGLPAEQALQAAREKFKSDPHAREVAVGQLKARYAEDAVVKAQAAKAVSTEAWSVLMAKGSMSAIPVATMAALRKTAPEEERQMRDWLELKWRRAKADGEGKANVETPEMLREFVRLRDMARDDPVSFVAIDPNTYQYSVTPMRLNALLSGRDGINKNDAKVQQLDQITRSTFKALHDEIFAAGVDLTPKETSGAKVARSASYKAEFEKRLGEAAGQGKIDAATGKRIARELIREGVVQGSGWMFDDKKLAFELTPDERKKFVTPFDKIPAETREEIIGDLYPGQYKKGGAVPSTVRAHVERAFMRGQK